MRAALDAAVRETGPEGFDAAGIYEDGYSAAIDDCAGLIRNWRTNDGERSELDAVVVAISKMKA